MMENGKMVRDMEKEYVLMLMQVTMMENINTLTKMEKKIHLCQWKLL